MQMPAEPIGQQDFTSSTTLTVPAGVQNLHMVCVGAASVTVRGTLVCSASGTLVGSGGNGGAKGLTAFDPPTNGIAHAGSGGAGGYTGNGGNGGEAVIYQGFPGFDGAAGSGGGGGGGGAGGRAAYPPDKFNDRAPGGAGGGVGLRGAGASGGGGVGGASTAGSYPPTLAGYSGNPGNPGSATGPTYGGGIAVVDYTSNSPRDGVAGANLRYTNNISVTGGESVTISIPGSANFTSAVRIMWGGGRSYPYNAGDM